MFKVGDKVKVLRSDYPDSIEVGDIVEVLGVVDGAGVHLSVNDKYPLYFYNKEVELVVDTIESRAKIAQDLLFEAAPSIQDLIDSSKLASERQIDGNHYSKLKIQPMEYALQNDLNYGQSNAIKYITRYKDKNGIEDLKKAIHCIELLIEFEEKK
jgi:hypothetical protein